MVTHHHLCLELLDSLKRNADDDDDRGAAQCNIAQVGVECANDERNQRDDAQEDRANKDNLAQCLHDEVGRGLAGTEARDITAVLLQVVRNLDGIKLDRKSVV